MKHSLFFLVSFLCVQWLQAQVIAGDFADPSIIKANDKYYAVGTSSEWAPHFPIYTSGELGGWQQVGYVFDKAPEWTSGSFWAPEYYYHNNTYYIYYTARRKSDNVSCIGVATSPYPDKGFKDHGVIVSFGKEAIDGFVYNDNGQLYITFKAYGLDNRPIEILGSKLSADGLKLEGEVFSMLRDQDKQGLEGQSILKKGNYYYLFYSAGGCCGLNCSYNVRVARSKKFKGPYENYSKNPILTDDDNWKCPGHGTFVQQEDGGYVYMHHAYDKQSNVWTGREALLAELLWPNNNDWPSFASYKKGRHVGRRIMNFPAYWQWDFRHSAPVVRQENGKLHLSGTIKEGNQSGLVLTVRPVSTHFEMTTTVENSNGAMKGLAFYGDAQQAMGVGVRNDSVACWSETGTMSFAKINPGIPVTLKLTFNSNLTINFFWSQEGADWKQLVPTIAPATNQLPQWDRSPRVGLHFNGLPNEEAVFSSFGVKNL